MVTRPAWQIVFARQAARQFERLTPDMRRRITDKLEGLIAEPPIGDIAKLQGTRNGYRLRVGEWRVMFSRNDEVRIVEITAVHPRRLSGLRVK